MMALDTKDEGALTLEDFKAAVKAVESQHLEAHTHMVSPGGAKRLAEGRQTCCHTCGAMLGGAAQRAVR